MSKRFLESCVERAGCASVGEFLSDIDSDDYADYMYHKAQAQAQV